MEVESKYLTGLRVKSTYDTEVLQEFVPIKGKTVKMYNCGPTVYDKSHMGHARTYISVDMLKKIMQKYFGYEVYYVMNITDIDDKIINRSNEKNQEFNEFARYWEADYFEQMSRLKIDWPDSLVRVSEYVPEIIEFIKKIEDNGYAYESEGSVYFDQQAYSKNPIHKYGKLKKIFEASEIEEAEGSLTQQVKRKSALDFVLWKASKPGEPKWDSPWGPGRPGWHIECSAMAHSILGQHIDIHCGGIDLSFPHHENEIAQSCAHYESENWVNYFVHTGHIHIDGLKMSKSLKNFITIEAILELVTPRQLRLMFALHRYDTLLNYKPPKQDENGKVDKGQLEESIEKDRQLTEFIYNAQALMRKYRLDLSQKWGEQEKQLAESLLDIQGKIHKHFQNNFDTPAVIDQLFELIRMTNVYFKQKDLKSPLIKKISDYVIFILESIGLEYTPEYNSFKNFPIADVVDLATELRDNIRQIAQDPNSNNATSFKLLSEKAEQFIKKLDAQKPSDQKTNEFIQQIIQVFKDVIQASNQSQKNTLMTLSDQLRDEILPKQGVRVLDRAYFPSIWMVANNLEEYLKEIEIKRQEKERAAQEKLQKALEYKQKQFEALQKMSIRPEDFLKNNLEKYSKFDERGIPTHDQEGKELNSKNRKYAEGVIKKQEEEYKKYLQYQIPPEQFFKQEANKYSQFDSNGIPTHDREENALDEKSRKTLLKQWEKQKQDHEIYLEYISSNKQ